MNSVKYPRDTVLKKSQNRARLKKVDKVFAHFLKEPTKWKWLSWKMCYFFFCDHMLTCVFFLHKIEGTYSVFLSKFPLLFFVVYIFLTLWDPCFISQHLGPNSLLHNFCQINNLSTVLLWDISRGGEKSTKVCEPKGTCTAELSNICHPGNVFSFLFYSRTSCKVELQPQFELYL